MNKNPPGLPRPLAKHKKRRKLLPVPWNVSTNPLQWDATDHERVGTAVREKLCQVCGLPLDAEAVFAVDAETGDIIDATGMHERCARLALAHCPYLQNPCSLEWKYNDTPGGIRLVHHNTIIAMEMNNTERLRLPKWERA